MNSAVKGCIAFWAVAGVVMIVALVVTSYKKLQSDEVGIQYNKLWKSLGDEVFTEGLHSGPVGFEFIIFPNVFTTLEYDDLVCLNKDGVDTQIDVAFQFKVVLRRMKDVVLDFKDFEGYKQVLRYSGSSVIHEACSLYDTAQFQAQRGKFQSALSANLTQRFLKLHADIKDLQVNNIKRPREYENAIRSKERAREDIEVARNERPRLLTEAETKRREAESDAQIIMDKAASDARVQQLKAHAEAEAIQTQFAREADAYEQIVRPEGLGFKAEGFISYLSTRVLAAAKHPVYIGLRSPAPTEYFSPQARASYPIEPPS